MSEGQIQTREVCHKATQVKRRYAIHSPPAQRAVVGTSQTAWSLQHPRCQSRARPEQALGMRRMHLRLQVRRVIVLKALPVVWAVMKPSLPTTQLCDEYDDEVFAQPMTRVNG